MIGSKSQNGVLTVEQFLGNLWSLAKNLTDELTIEAFD